MPRKYRKFSPEFRDEAVRLVLDQSRPIAQVARELGVNEGTRGNWVNQYRVTHADDEPPLTPAERIQLAEAQRELRELRMENEFPKKSRGVLRPGSPVTELYEFVDSFRLGDVKCADQGKARYLYPVKKMCAWLGVSSSGFFDWRGRPASATAQRRADLTDKIAVIFGASDGTYGYRRVHAQLAREGQVCGPELVRSLMLERGLVSCQPRPRVNLTKADGREHHIPDLLGQDFTAFAPGLTMIGDIT